MKPEWKKLLVLNLPYLLFVYLFAKCGQAYRLAAGADASAKLLHLTGGISAAFASPLPSLHPFDLCVGLAGAMAVRLIVYSKGKNAKKYRKGEEYGSARWGTAKDITPYIDPKFENNILLTQTERLTMTGRPKDPKTARNKNVLVIGGSGSGKTRFYVKPNLMQCFPTSDYPTSFVVTDPKGTVENYEAFFDALKQESPVPISFEDIPGGAKGFFSSVESRVAIQEGMSEIQTVKTAIHEIAHAKLHAVKPDEKAAPEDRKDRHTKEVEAESVAYTVCQRYGIETSDYSFGYIAGWSSGKETKELKSSLDIIRKTAAEMIEGIDAKLKVLLAEKAQSAEKESEMSAEPMSEAPIYRETANYAYEAGELESYRAFLSANVECRRAIEAAISSNYGDNRLDADAAVKSVLEQFSPERVRYVLANTIQQKDFDGRIPQPLKEWAKSVEVCPENASRFLVDKPNPGLTALFVDAFRQQTEPQKEAVSEKTEERDPEVVAWENDEITSVEVKTVEVKSPFAPFPEEAAKAPKAHRLTAEEKEIKAAVMDTLKGQIAYTTECGRPIAPLTIPLICWHGMASKSRATRSRRTVSRCSKSIAVMQRGKHRAVTVS